MINKIVPSAQAAVADIRDGATIMIGGFGSVPGAILGGIIVGAIEIFGASYVSSSFKDALVFASMFLFLLVRPQGISGERVADRA